MRSLAVALALLVGPAAAEAPQPLPFDLGGPFTLVDQDGRTRTEADPDGRRQLLFFGYANCQEICSAALPLMADVADRLAADGIAIRPVMITVDPERDTVGAIGAPLRQIHPDFVGLTGDATALQTAYDAFGIEREFLFADPEFGPVYAHGSLIYLLGPDGRVETLLPPVLSSEAMAGIVRGYAAPGEG